MVTVTNGDNETFVSNRSPQSEAAATCCGSAVKTEQSERVYTGAFIRHVDGPVIIKDTAEHTAPGPGRITDLEAEYREEEHEVTLGWSVPDSQTEIEKFSLSYSHDIDSVIRGLETRDVVLSHVPGQSRVSQVLPGPEVASPTMVYYVVRSEDSAGRLSLVSNILYLNITRGSRQDTWIGDIGRGLGDTDYTLLGVVLGVITVFSLLTILGVSAWLTRRRASSRDKLRAMNGFTNKVSSTGVNVVIDKTLDTSRDLSQVTHVASGPSVSSLAASSVVVPPSSTSFANNITPTYWSASQLLADHETRSRKPRESHHHHGQHYHQYYPVHHQLHHHHYDVEDQDMSDILEDNNNDVANSSDQSSSTIVMLNTSMSSSNTGTGGSVRKKNITQV